MVPRATAKRSPSPKTGRSAPAAHQGTPRPPVRPAARFHSLSELSQLKVVVYWGDVLYDTLVCRPNESLTVGHAPGNIIVVPPDRDFSRDTIELVRVLDEQSAMITFDHSIEGHVYLGKEFLRLNAAVESGKALQNPDGTHWMRISKRDRADLVIGHLSFSLDWVSDRHRLLKSNSGDRLAAVFWTGFITLALLFSVFTLGQYEPDIETDVRPERLVRVQITKPKPEPPPPIVQKAPQRPAEVPGVKAAKLAQKPPKPPKGLPAPAAKPQGAPKATGPTPEQIAIANTQRKKAELSKSLSFISKPTGNFKVAPNVFAPTSEKYSKSMNAVAGKLSKSGNQSVLNYIPSTSEASGPIQTKGVRGIQKGLAFSEHGVVGGQGVYPGQVRGKVAIADLYGKGGNEVGGALSAEGGMTLSGEGTLPEGLIEKALAKRLERFQYCYEKALLSDPTLAGTIKMQWTIVPGGRATGPKVVRSQLNHKGLHECISRELSQITFPSPKGGSVTVTKPFSFSSTTL